MGSEMGLEQDQGLAGAQRADLGGGRGRVLAAPHRSPDPQVLFNVAAAQCALGLWAEATRSLEAATAKGPEGARGDLRLALTQVQVRGRVRRAGRPPLGSASGVQSCSLELTHVQTPQNQPSAMKTLPEGGSLGVEGLGEACGETLLLRLGSAWSTAPRNRLPCSPGWSPGARSSGPRGGTWRTWSGWISWARPR